MKAKRTILILSDWFLPGYKAGGPIQSIANLVAHLHHEFKIKIITTDRDFKSNQAYDSVEVDKWLNLYGVEVYYVGIDNLHSNYILNLIQSTSHDLLYLNSLFSKYFAVMPLRWKKKGLINSKIVLAPRGMLGEGSLKIKSFKKQFFLTLAKWFGWFENIIWQSTSDQETFEIFKRIGLKSKIIQVYNFPSFNKSSNKIQKKEGYLKLFFISRISEKKNLKFAIDVLKLVHNIDLIFDVYGPIEDQEYWNICMENSKLLPENIFFNYKGVLKPSEIASTISKYHALFLPTLNENYGHIIVETFQNSRPVIISNQTPWLNLENEQIGFDIDLMQKQKYIDSIQKLSSLSQDEFDLLCTKSCNYISEKLNIEAIKKEYINLFSK